MSNRQTLKDSHSAIFSQELEDGQEPCRLRGGVQTDLFGQEALPVNPSQQQGKEKEKMTSDISGLSSLISSESANLQQSLENRLQRLSDMGGSTIYKLTLRKKDTPQGRSYFQLAASAPRIKENGFSSWPTPTAATGGASKNPNNKRGINGGNPMATAASLVPWLTPTTSDMNGVRELDGKRSGGLNTQVMSAWPTPMSSDNRDRGKFSSPAIQRRIQKGKSIELSMLVESINPWATPNTMDHMKQRSDEALFRAKQKAGCSNLKDQIPYSGQAQKSSIAETENIAPSQLNPRFSLWLMGYPTEWAYSGEAVTPLSRKRQRKS